MVVAFTGMAVGTGHEITFSPRQQADQHWYWDCIWAAYGDPLELALEFDLEAPYDRHVGIG